MKPAPDDSQNSVPEVSSGDQWENDDGPAVDTVEDKGSDSVSFSEANGIPSGRDGRLNRSRVREISPKKDVVSKSRKPKKFIGKAKDEAEDEAEEGAKSDKRKRRRKIVRGERSDWGGKGGSSSLRWIMFAGAGILVVIILTVVLDQRRDSEEKVVSDISLFGELVDQVDPESEAEGAGGLPDGLAKGQEIASAIYAKFTTAKSIEDFQEILFQKEEVMPLVEKHWKPGDARADWHPDDLTSWAIVDEEGFHYGVLSGTGPDFTQFLAFFCESESGLKLDWKATSGYGTSPFAMLKTGEGDAEEIRAYLSATDFYTLGLPDDKFKSYRLKSPDEEHVLWVYVDLGSELAVELDELFVPSQITGDAMSDLHVTVSLERGPEDSLPNQWILKDLIHLSWVEK